jgi:hypothetical protein
MPRRSADRWISGPLSQVRMLGEDPDFGVVSHRCLALAPCAREPGNRLEPAALPNERVTAVRTAKGQQLVA